jgi:hypothetical protein
MGKKYGNDFFKLILDLFIEALSVTWDRLMYCRMGVDYLAHVWNDMTVRCFKCTSMYV